MSRAAPSPSFRFAAFLKSACSLEQLPEDGTVCLGSVGTARYSQSPGPAAVELLPVSTRSGGAVVTVLLHIFAAQIHVVACNLWMLQLIKRQNCW